MRPAKKRRNCGAGRRPRSSARRIRCYEFEQRAVAQTKAAAHATDNWVHEHPWTAMGVAAGLAFLVGLAVNRK